MNKFILTLDASQINEFQMCHLSWWYTYKENLRLAGARTEALDSGTLVHKLLDLYYNLRWLDPNGNKLVQATHVIIMFKEASLTKSLFPEDKGELEDFLCNRFLLYVERYRVNDFILPQTKLSPVELGFSKLLYEDKNVKFIVEGRIDLINLILRDKLVFTDHKSQGKKQDLYNYRTQFKTYAWATGYEYGMVNYFGLQDKYVEGNTFRQTLINFPKWMIEEWEQKMLAIFWTITHLINNEASRPEENIYQVRNDSNCEGQYGHPCVFTSICETGNWEGKQKMKTFKYNKVDSWSPWSLNNVN